LSFLSYFFLPYLSVALLFFLSLLPRAERRFSSR
jgi:hypothetical protein